MHEQTFDDNVYSSRVFLKTKLLTMGIGQVSNFNHKILGIWYRMWESGLSSQWSWTDCGWLLQNTGCKVECTPEVIAFFVYRRRPFYFVRFRTTTIPIFAFSSNILANITPKRKRPGNPGMYRLCSPDCVDAWFTTATQCIKSIGYHC